MLTSEENLKLEKEFPDLKYPVPPVSTANWDYQSWRKWMLSHAWVRVKNDYVHYLTGEKRLWHPLVTEIAEPTYKKAKAWCRNASDKHNRRNK